MHRQSILLVVIFSQLAFPWLPNTSVNFDRGQTLMRVKALLEDFSCKTFVDSSACEFIRASAAAWSRMSIACSLIKEDAMHIEPGLIPDTKIVLSYATAAAAGAYALSHAAKEVRQSGIGLLLARTLIATAFVFVFFEVLPKFSAGVSEVHFIFGSTIFLLLGTAPAAFGLALGLLLQGIFMAPTDLPQYGANVTTLLIPLFAVSALAQHVISRETRYIDISYKQMLSLSAIYQAGIVSWVIFWVLYGNGVAIDSFESLARFTLAYMPVILIEPLADVALLWLAKTMHAMPGSSVLQPRLNQAG